MQIDDIILGMKLNIPCNRIMRPLNNRYVRLLVEINC
jgi:hypothetical protein